MALSVCLVSCDEESEKNGKGHCATIATVYTCIYLVRWQQHMVHIWWALTTFSGTSPARERTLQVPPGNGFLFFGDGCEFFSCTLKTWNYMKPSEMKRTQDKQRKKCYIRSKQLAIYACSCKTWFLFYPFLTLWFDFSWSVLLQHVPSTSYLCFWKCSPADKEKFHGNILSYIHPSLAETKHWDLAGSINAAW